MVAGAETFVVVGKKGMLYIGSTLHRSLNDIGSGLAPGGHPHRGNHSRGCGNTAGVGVCDEGRLDGCRHGLSEIIVMPDRDRCGPHGRTVAAARLGCRREVSALTEVSNEGAEAGARPSIHRFAPGAAVQMSEVEGKTLRIEDTQQEVQRHHECLLGVVGVDGARNRHQEIRAGAGEVRTAQPFVARPQHVSCGETPESPCNPVGRHVADPAVGGTAALGCGTRTETRSGVSEGGTMVMLVEQATAASHR